MQFSESARFYRKWRRRGALLSGFTPFFAFAGAVITAIWALVQYSGNQEDDRTKYTLEFIKEWESGGYGNAYGQLREAYTDFVRKASPADRQVAANSEHGRLNFLKNFAIRMKEDDNRRYQIRKVVYYFNRLGLCEASDVCSHDTTVTFFDDTVRTFVDVFQPYIEANSDMLPGDSTTIRDFSRRLNPNTIN